MIKRNDGGRLELASLVPLDCDLQITERNEQARQIGGLGNRSLKLRYSIPNSGVESGEGCKKPLLSHGRYRESARAHSPVFTLSSRVISQASILLISSEYASSHRNLRTSNSFAAVL